MKVYLTEDVRNMDKQTIEAGIDGIILMENAAFAVTAKIFEQYLTDGEGRVLVCAGTGNNGGDGFAVARQLLARGVDAYVILFGKESDCRSADLQSNMKMAKISGVPVFGMDALTDEAFKEEVQRADVVVDSIFGTGLSRDIDGRIKDRIGIMNAYAARILAVDIPSGIHSDTGKVMGIAVKAESTVTFEVMKPGLVLAEGDEHTGTIYVCPIGIPQCVIEKTPSHLQMILPEDIPALLPERKERSNKGDYGKVYCLCGSEEMPGALALAAKAAYKTGCGLVVGCSTKTAVQHLRSFLPEAIGKVLPDVDGSLVPESLKDLDIEGDRHVCILGPGLSVNEGTTGFVREVIGKYDVPMVIDADALNVLSILEKEEAILCNLARLGVITPHPREMSRLAQLPVEQILADPVNTALAYAKAHKVVVVLKDHRTVVASPEGEAYINATGNASMAKGGAGDVLTGIIVGLMAQGTPAFRAAALGVCLHGMAGDLAKEDLSEYGVLARDLIEYLPKILSVF